MSAAGVAEMIAFGLSAFIAVAGALGMATTMSMFRSGIFLMASFMGAAGLFILLSADLLGVLQIMMYIGGMLVMILFMVLFMPDPGGAMMADMPGMMTPIERFFSLGLAQKNPEGDAAGGAPHDSHAMHHDHGQEQGPENAGGGHGGMEGVGDMDMSGMSMVTPVRAWAAWVAIATGGALTALLLLRPAWPVSGAAPDPRSAEQLGALLMGKYMIGFEGAGFLILVGVFGAVFTGRPDRHPDPHGRQARTAVAEAPSPIDLEPLDPLVAPSGNDSAPAADKGSPHGHHAGHGDHA